MIEVATFAAQPSRAGVTRHNSGTADILVAAIRKPLDALEAAAEEAANGMLGGTKLGLLVAATGLIDALKAVDAEFARQYESLAARRIATQHGRHDPGNGHV